MVAPVQLIVLLLVLALVLWFVLNFVSSGNHSVGNGLDDEDPVYITPPSTRG